MKKLKIRITFVEELLGTQTGNADLYREYIGKQAPDASTLEDEVSAIGVDAVVEKGKTVFPKLPDGTPFLYDYQIKGHFKNACSVLRRCSGERNPSAKIKAFKKEIDGLIFPQPRTIPLVFPGEIGECSRPLRASTPQGERVALALSESVPAGAWAEFEILILEESLEPAVKQWLDYGALNGLGQWHNGGKGRFTYEVL